MNRCFNFFNLIVLSFLISSCGQNVCVMGFGQCDAPEKPTQTTTALTLTATKTSLALNESTTLTIAGGVSPYKMEFVGTQVGTLSATGVTVGTFSTATSYTYSSSSAGTATLKVTDSASTANTKTIAIIVESSL